MNYVVIRAYTTRTGKPRAIAAGPFQTRSKAESFMKKFLREEWYLPRSEFIIAPIRPVEERLRTWHEEREDLEL